MLRLAAAGLLAGCGAPTLEGEPAPMPTRAATSTAGPTPILPTSTLAASPSPTVSPTVAAPPGLRIRPTTAPFTAIPRPPVTPEPTPIPVEVLVDYSCVTGECAHWHPMEQCVYWVDIPKGQVFRYFPATRKHEMVFENPLMIGGLTIQQDGALLLFMEHGAIKQLKNGALSTILEDVPEERETRFNDAIADPEGRVFCGTMPTDARPGHLYRLDVDRSLAQMEGSLGISNGMGFSPDLKYFYHTDSTARIIYRYDYERSGGGLSNRRELIRTSGQGVPDGLTVDAEGYIWSARWDGSMLVRYTPAGAVDQTIYIAARKVSSVAFGGSGYGDIYITSGGGDNKVREGSNAGALFRVQMGIKGKAEFYSKIRA